MLLKIGREIYMKGVNYSVSINRDFVEVVAGNAEAWNNLSWAKFKSVLKPNSLCSQEWIRALCLGKPRPDVDANTTAKIQPPPHCKMSLIKIKDEIFPAQAPSEKTNKRGLPYQNACKARAKVRAKIPKQVGL